MQEFTEEKSGQSGSNALPVANPEAVKAGTSPTAMLTVGVKLPASLHATLKAQGKVSGRALKHEALAQLQGAVKARSILRQGLQDRGLRGMQPSLEERVREALEALGVPRDKQP